MVLGLIFIEITRGPLFCRDNPVHFNILHDLSKPFYYTKDVYIEINSFEVAISAVRLRSWKSFNPVEINQCETNEIYDPATNLCADYGCRKPRCNSKLKISHATLNCTGKAEGDRCEVTCNSGYTPKETSVVSCSFSGIFSLVLTSRLSTLKFN